MNRCIELAQQGAGYAAPNPLVGSVIVWKDTILGEGFHEQYGNAHAEVNAIKSVSDESLLPDSILYVNLEPCAHHGKTPPCADLIIEKKIKKVVIGCMDSYSEVAGKGIEKLRQAGIEVIVGVLEKDSRFINRRFFTFHEKKRPYVILKWAQSTDHFIDIERASGEKGTYWITGPETKKTVHRWRSEEAAILVGKNTIANDNPQLTVREVKGHSPVRVIIDQKLRLDYGAYKVGDRTTPTIILSEKVIHSGDNLKFVQPASFSVGNILNALHQLEIQSVLVEGGKETLQRFIDSGLWDEVRVLTGTTELKKGLPAPVLNVQPRQVSKIGEDHLNIYFND